MANATRTTNPLHFEDLEPHKFEDVVRGLLYDFRDWQTIEPTGKGGSDDGYDARAWEKVKIVDNEDEDKEDEDNQKGERLMEGNRWMIQCKREKTITPKDIQEILEDIDLKDPPYGYILAAACDFSKTSHDKFREILLAKGVAEFYLWSKGYLEDQLYLPKNDHILFTAFGISLNTRRRSRKTEIRFALNNKNKIFRIWGGARSNNLEYKSALIRDFEDENYPYEGEYSDFEKNPRWSECIPFQYHPLGVWFHIRNFYAYCDADKKEFDFFRGSDLLNRPGEMRLQKKTEEDTKLEGKVEDFWQHLPINNQAKLEIDGLIYFKDMLLIDDKGDHWCDFPHIFVEFNKNGKRPFSGYRYTLLTSKGDVYVENEFKQIKVFPKQPTKIKLGKVRKDKLDIPYKSVGLYESGVSRNGYVFSMDKNSSLKKGEIVTVTDEDTGSSSQPEDRQLEVTHTYETTVKQFIKEHSDYPYRNYIKEQVKKEVTDDDRITVFEVRAVYKWMFNEEKSGSGKSI